MSLASHYSYLQVLLCSLIFIHMRNFDQKTIDSFGDEWNRFDQSQLDPLEGRRRFEEYFKVFPWDLVSTDSSGFDMGCGTGRWAQFLAPHVGTLHCIDPSTEALAVAKKNLVKHDNVRFYVASVDQPPLPPGSQDFGISLGVLHHVPDTQLAIHTCVSLLKPGAPFLLYLYYDFGNRPAWFKYIWKVSDICRRIIFKLPRRLKNLSADLIAIFVYMPLLYASQSLEKFGFDVSNLPLSYYRKCSFYTIRTDSRDRFGTPIERRFSKNQIISMLTKAGLERISFSSSAPYWCVNGFKRI